MNMPADADLLELLYAYGDVLWSEALTQMRGDRLLCLRITEELRKKSFVDIWEAAGEERTRIPLWRWHMLFNVTDEQFESRIVLRKTIDGDAEWGRLYHKRNST